MSGGERIVLADDLTGACEVAALAHNHGRRTRVLLAPGDPGSGAATVVCDTGTRLSEPGQAARAIERAVRDLHLHRGNLFFKKTDSVLRGPVAAELTALAGILGFTRILLVPANPALGRIVENGRYRIGERPIHETDFARDPHHPARSDDVRGLLGETPGWTVHTLRPDAPLPADGLIVGDACHGDDLRHWAGLCDENTLAAGSAAFFRALLEREDPAAVSPSCETVSLDRPTLLVSGTTAVASKRILESAFGPGEALGDFAPADPDRWAAALRQRLLSGQPAAAFFEHCERPDPARAGPIAEALAEVARRVLANLETPHLIVEGGATAAAIADKLGWRRLRVVREWSPGVVSLSPEEQPEVLFTLKPGSYPWPTAIDNLFKSAPAPART